ncbi:OmpA family protein [Geminicoccus flavidas]|uniref:OmpA family protein n=1 Tax=Geminicoccus flavidas TaxID=2506407 RepID=UPI00190FB55E|nr:OmpA family protein [Geminicoccus flavidas]
MRRLLKPVRPALIGVAVLLVPAAVLAGPPAGPAPPAAIPAAVPDPSARELEAIIDAVRMRVDGAQPAAANDARQEERLALAQERVRLLDQEVGGLRQEVARLRQQLTDADIANRSVTARHDELAKRLRNAEHASERLAMALERREKALRDAQTERDRVLATTGDEVRLVEASAVEARRAAAEDAASALTRVAELEARLEATQQDFARLNLVLAERDRQLAELQGGKGKERELALHAQAELRQQLDQLTAERDKIRVEAAAQIAVVEAKLADAGRQLDAMSEEVRQAWADRTVAEQRLQEQASQAESRLAKAEQALAAERTGRAREVERLQDDLARARTRAAAMDGVSQEVGRHAAELAKELADMRGVASASVAEAIELGQQLVEALAELDTLRQLMARLELVRSGQGEPPADTEAAEVWPIMATELGDELEYGGDAPGLDEEPAAAPRLSLPVLGRLSGLKLEETADGWIRTVPTGIEFELGGRLIDAGSARGLERVATLIQLSPGARVRVVGHTDSEGDRYRNLTLSVERARALRDALAGQFEIDPARIEVDGMGPDEPIASNKTVEGRSANRRVEVFVAR